MENVRSEVALWQVPARPSAQRGTTYTLSLCGIWVQQVATQASFFVEARSLVRYAPTWNKRSSELLVVTRGLLRAQERNQIRKHPLGKSSSVRVVCIVEYLIEPCEWPLECFAILWVREHSNSIGVFTSCWLVRVSTRASHRLLLGEGSPELWRCIFSCWCE